MAERGGVWRRRLLTAWAAVSILWIAAAAPVAALLAIPHWRVAGWFVERGLPASPERIVLGPAPTLRYSPQVWTNEAVARQPGRAAILAAYAAVLVVPPGLLLIAGWAVGRLRRRRGPGRHARHGDGGGAPMR